MQSQIYSAIMAIMLGAVVCVIFFVPFVAVSYRRRGKLSVGRLVVWVSAAVYGLAIWTYTILPLPQSNDYACVGVSLSPLTIVDDIRSALATGNPLTSMFLLQLVFNVLLFVPLGFFLRVLAGRGIVVAGAVGLSLSLLIEFTQLTGVWGLYPCAYRVFDVADLITNTLGALVGAAIALLIPAHRRATGVSAVASEPRPVTRARRLLAMLCDVVGFWLVAAGLMVGLAIGSSLLLRTTDIGEWPGVVATAVAVILWSVMTLATGQSVGDYAVMLRYVEPRVAQPIARLLRLAGGVVGWYLVGLVPLIGSQLTGGFVFAALVLLFMTPDSRGLPGLISGQRLVDAREPRDR